MRKSFGLLAPVEIIVEIFIIMAIFVALVACFMIVTRTFNALPAAIQQNSAQTNY
ncbi:MAG: hypothetical protein WD157_01950 [Patescibacteria group bacterium]